MSEAYIATLTCSDNDGNFFVLFPAIRKLEELIDIDLRQPDSFGQLRIDALTVDELDFELFDGVAEISSNDSELLRSYSSMLQKKKPSAEMSWGWA
jgi:hypothetical protein